ncbi:uncharacterized protein LOC144545694 [Carex rostrata]
MAFAQSPAKLAKLRRELLTPSSIGGGAAGEGFDVMKSGDMLIELSRRKKAANIKHDPDIDLLMKLLDLLGIIEGAKDGKGFPPSSKGRFAKLPQRGCSAILVKLRRSMRLDYYEEIMRKTEGISVT